MGTIEKGPDGELKFSPGLFETEAMMRRGHEEFWGKRGGADQGDSEEGSKDPRDKKDKKGR